MANIFKTSDYLEYEAKAQPCRWRDRFVDLIYKPKLFLKENVKAFSEISWFLEDIIEEHIDKHDANELLEWHFEMPIIRKKEKKEKNPKNEIEFWTAEDGTELSMIVEHNACIIELVCRPRSGSVVALSTAPMA